MLKLINYDTKMFFSYFDVTSVLLDKTGLEKKPPRSVFQYWNDKSDLGRKKQFLGIHFNYDKTAKINTGSF